MTGTLFVGHFVLISGPQQTTDIDIHRPFLECIASPSRSSLICLESSWVYHDSDLITSWAFGQLAKEAKVRPY